MAKVEWCPECKRAKGIGCACDLSFKEKVKDVGVGKHSLKYGNSDKPITRTIGEED